MNENVRDRHELSDAALNKVTGGIIDHNSNMVGAQNNRNLNVLRNNPAQNLGGGMLHQAIDKDNASYTKISEAMAQEITKSTGK